MLRKTVSGLMLALLLMSTLTLFWSFSPGQAQTTTVYLDPSSITVTVNAVVKVDIMVSNVENLWAWQVGLKWNPLILTFVGIEWGDFISLSNPPTWLRIDPVVDDGHFKYVPPGSLPALESTIRGGLPVSTTTPLRLFTVKFLAISPGSTSLNLQDVSLISHDPYTTRTYSPGPDTNGDGLIDIMDLYFVCRYWKDGVYNSPADVDGDSVIDIKDIAIVTNDYGKKNTDADWGVTHTKEFISLTTQDGGVNVLSIPPEIEATVDIKPDTLNLYSRGEHITSYIELPEGHNVSDINVSSIMLNDTIGVDSSAPATIGDYDNDTIPDLMVKFDRQQVINYVMANVDMSKLYEERFMTITLTVTGKLNDGTPFQGSDTVKIILPMPRCWRLLAKLGIYPF